ncbi:hypothetical protein SAMN02910398_03172, partial [Butyrivibrio sp. YAB3001]
IKIAREREDFLRYQEAREKKISDLTQEVSSLTSEVAKLHELLEKNGISYESSEN